MPSGELRIALISEKKNPPDKRVAFSPGQCLRIMEQYPKVRFLVEPSKVRCIPDADYTSAGITLTNDPGSADVLFGIKEVPAEELIPGKTYFFFSHTIKKQAHNQKLLAALLRNNITMVDYECLQDDNGNRTVAFGRFAGIVGAYNGLRMWLRKKNLARLPSASECADMTDMLEQVRPCLPMLKHLKIVLTGTGRVGSGAMEVLKNLGIRQLLPADYLAYQGEEPVFSILSSCHYHEKNDGSGWDETEFRKNPSVFHSTFGHFAASTDLLISCHFWNPAAPLLFTLNDIRKPEFRISVISDVTCDIGGSIPTTLRASSIESPFYDVNKADGRETEAFSGENNISVCAVDNLPCELPLDASLAFGEMLMAHVLPELVTGNHKSVAGATICREGRLCPAFNYLQDFAEGKG